MTQQALSPRCARTLRRVAHWLNEGDLDAAAKALVQARALAPNHPEVVRAEAALRQQLAPSLEELERAVAQQPGSARARIDYARALRSARRFAAARDQLLEACKLAPDLPYAWFNLGTLFYMAAEPGRARDAFERAHALAPAHLPTLLGYAESLKMLGDIEGAAKHLRAVLRRAPAHAHAWHSLTNLKTVPLEEAEIAQLEQVYARAKMPDPARAVAGFALGAALERAGRCADAYRTFVEANTLKRREVEWNAAWFRRVVDILIAQYETPIAGVSDPTFGRDAIFLVSLPRSGSTLTEQILCSHADVAAGDELRDVPTIMEEESRRRGAEHPAWIADASEDDWRRLGQTYLDRTAKRRGARARLTDKGLANWQFIGAIRAMLPGARIVHVQRDPLETCWSCFTQFFPIGQHFSYDLDEMAAFWRDYARLMAFWHERYPGAIHDFVYERLVENPETEIRALLDACDLAFDPACLAFHATERDIRTPSSAQVREPLRRDTARTARYGTALDPLRRALGIDS